MLHYLNNKWSFWYLRGQRKSYDDWEKNLFKIATFETIEDYYGLFEAALPPSCLVPGADYYLFRDGIKPMWEDPANRNGGRWVLISRGKDAKFVDTLFTKMCDSLIGGRFNNFENEICGIALNVRGKHDKVAVWIRDTNIPAKVESIGLAIKHLVGYQSKISFELHCQAKNRNGSIHYILEA
uniref:EIF-4F 25 kDa subunit n=1 Tax=Panagrolaimus sp. JU765 TaxID=591449 RepID=A0AC34Q0I9_9BILA